MRVLMIGTHDPSIFDAKSVLYRRTEAYSKALGHLTLIDTTTRKDAFEPFHTTHFSVFGTNSWSRFLTPFGAARLAKRLGGEIITTQDPFEHGFAGVRAARALGVPLHVQLHTDPFAPGFIKVGHPMSDLNRIRLRLLPYVLTHAARIRVVSGRLKDEIERRYRLEAPITVLPIYTDLSRFKGVRRAREKGHLLWIGRFEREKDPMLALETLAALRASRANARLVMLGVGSLKKALIARAKARGLNEYLELPGYADPVPYLARAELVLATSCYEGYGLSILEALSASVPVLSTDVGIAKEAGATTASREEFIQKAVELMRAGPPAPPPITPPYPSFEAYVEAYAADIRATAQPAA